MASPRQAAQGAQLMLNRRGEAGLKTDGIWGVRSSKAFRTSEPGLKADVNDFVEKAGYSVAKLGVLTGGASYGLWSPISKIASYCRDAAAATGLAENTLIEFVRMEAAQKVEDGVRLFNEVSVAPNGLFHGLMQMGRPAWTDVQVAYPATPDFLSGRYNGAICVLAGARYALINQRYLRAKGFKGEFTVQVMYGAHNQGAAGFIRLLSGKATSNFDNQSSTARAFIRTALAQSGVSLA